MIFGIPTALAPEVDAAITIAVAGVVAWLAKVTVRRAMGLSNPLVSAAAQRTAVIVVWVAGLVIAFQELGVAVEVLLLVLALFGAAAIVALRIPLENYGAKYFEDVYTPFKRGDTIRVGPFEGTVVELNAMSTVLLTGDDRLVALPNSMLLREATVNLSPQAWRELTVPISVPASVDLARFEADMLKTLGKLRPHLDPRYPPVFSTRSRSVQGADLTLTVMVRRPEDREPVLTEVHQRLSRGLARGGGAAPPVPAAAPEPRPPGA